MNIIYLIRHADVLEKESDLVLSELGIEQSKKLSKVFKNNLPDITITSGRTRVNQTLQIMLNNLEYEIGNIYDNRLEGIKIKYPLKFYKSFEKSYPKIELIIDDRFQENNPPKDLEESEDFTILELKGKRAQISLSWEGKEVAIKSFIEALYEYMEKYSSILIVTHANIIQNVLQKLFSQHLDLETINQKTQNTCITTLIFDGNKFKLNSLLNVNHLI